MNTMSLRLLFGMLASALPDEHSYTETVEVPEKGNYSSKFQSGENYAQIDIPGAARLHIGMLSISLIVGLAYGGYAAYTCWTDKDIFLGYIRNLVIALVCRTFFSIIFDGVILLGSPLNVGGGNTLSALEQIFINLVLGFWLSLTVYAHARVQRNFKSEPTLRLYQYGIPVVAAFFALVWIFTMQHACPNLLWWAILSPFSPWIVHSANLAFLLIQLVLVGDMGRMMIPVKSSLDNDSLSLLRKVAGMMIALVLIFWLQFGLSLGYYKLKQPYLYFFFFFDGIEGTLVSVCFYFFYRWVTPLRKNSRLSAGSGETEITTVDEREEEVLPGGRGIVTVDSICVTTESGRWKTPEDESSKDVVYSNVVQPHRLRNTLELYKRFNVIPNQVTVVDGEQFYDCHIPPVPERINQKASPALIDRKTMEPTQKKNAFYASKYLILDSKEGEIPKYLETRPSVPESPKKQQRAKTDSFKDFEVGEIVRKWLNDNSESMPKGRKPESMIEDKELSRRDSDLKTSELSIETTQENLAVKEVDNNRVEIGKQNIRELAPKPHPETHMVDNNRVELGKQNIAELAPKPHPETHMVDNNRVEIGKQNIPELAPKPHPETHMVDNNRVELGKQNIRELAPKPHPETHMVDNNRVELGKQNIPELAPKPHLETHISLDLITENDAGAPKTETPADVQNTDTGIPSEGDPSQSLNASELAPKHEVTNTTDAHAPEPTKMNEPEAKDKPTESIKPYLTYSELLELRSKRENSNERPASTTESILSKVINHFLTSLTGYVQADKDFTTDKRLPSESHTKDEQEVQTDEKLKELPREKAKHPDLTISSLPKKSTAEQAEDARARPESIQESELTLENEIKSDEFDIRGMQNLEPQSSIANRKGLPQELTEEELSLSESSLGSDSTRQKPDEDRQESSEPLFERQSLDIGKVQPPIERQALDIGKVQPPIERQASDISKVQPPIERQSSDVSKVQPPIERQSLDIGKVQPPIERQALDIGKVQPPIERQSLDIGKVQPPIERQSSDVSKVQPPIERQSLDIGKVQPPIERQALDIGKVQPPIERQALDIGKVQPPIERQALDIGKVQPPTERQSSDVSKVQPPIERQSLDIGKVQPPIERQALDISKVQPPIERQALDISKVQPPHKLTEDKEKSIKRFLGSNLEQQSSVFPLRYYRPQQKLIQDEEELAETSSDSEFSIEKRHPSSSVLRKRADEIGIERFSESESERESLDSNQNLQSQKRTPDEELLTASSDSEFSIEKRHSSSSVLRKRADEIAIERFSESESERESLDSNQNLQSQKRTPDEELLTASSDSEFSIEKRQSFTNRKPNRIYPILRTLGAAAPQSQATAETDSEDTLERKPSSSSESFSLQNYYAKVLRARSQFQK